MINRNAFIPLIREIRFTNPLLALSEAERTASLPLFYLISERFLRVRIIPGL